MPLGSLRGAFFTAFYGANAALIVMCRALLLFAAPLVYPVGYQSLDIPQGYALATPTFYKVGGGAVSIQDIIPSANAPDGKDGINFVKFQLLDANSEVKDLKTYYWYNCTKTPFKQDPYTLHGWYETAAASRDTPLSELTINPGEAFYLNCSKADVYLTFSGEVKTQSCTIGINQGYTLVGNPYPAKVGIQDLTPIGDNVPDGKDGINFVKFQLLDANSEVKDLKTYYWYNCTKTPFKQDPYTLKGWYETAAASRDTQLSELEIPAGCGLYTQCPVENISIEFKGL